MDKVKKVMNNVFVNKQYLWVAILFLVCFNLNIKAQGKKNRNNAKKPEKVIVRQQSSESILFQSMLQNADKLLVIDSVVVSKETFLNHLFLTPDNGTLVQVQNDVIYTNGFDTKRVIAKGDSINGRGLYLSQKTSEGWNLNKAIKELNSAFSLMDYPFMLSDGVTLFFAGKGENSIGGYDIFTTRFDVEKGVFYAAENCGMPYSSPANDYLLVIDEVYNLGWLVSDRFQSVDKVCIYTFIPNKNGEKLSQEVLSDEEKRKLALLESIKTTWKFGNVDQAKKRFNQLKNALLLSPKEDNSIFFIINDQKVYTSLNQFKSVEARRLFSHYETQKKEFNAIRMHLKGLRNLFEVSKVNKLTDITKEILMLEETLLDKEMTLKQYEKEIRVLETRNLNL